MIYKLVAILCIFSHALMLPCPAKCSPATKPPAPTKRVVIVSSGSGCGQGCCACACSLPKVKIELENPAKPVSPRPWRSCTLCRTCQPKAPFLPVSSRPADEVPNSPSYLAVTLAWPSQVSVGRPLADHTGLDPPLIFTSHSQRQAELAVWRD